MIKIFLIISFFYEFCLRSSILFYYDIQIVAVNISLLSLFCCIASNCILSSYIYQVYTYLFFRGLVIISYIFTTYTMLDIIIYICYFSPSHRDVWLLGWTQNRWSAWQMVSDFCSFDIKTNKHSFLIYQKNKYMKTQIFLKQFRKKIIRQSWF